MTAVNEATTAAGATDLAIWRAAMYRALSAAFSYPDADALEQLTVDLEELCEHPLTAEWKLLPATAALFEAVREADAESQGARDILFGPKVLRCRTSGVLGDPRDSRHGDSLLDDVPALFLLRPLRDVA